MKSQAMATANQLKKAFGFTRSYSLKLAWVIVKIKSGREVVFCFQKADGETRQAKSIAVPADYQFKSERGGKSPLNIVTYFDGDRAAFRRFDVRRFISNAA